MGVEAAILELCIAIEKENTDKTTQTGLLMGSKKNSNSVYPRNSRDQTYPTDEYSNVWSKERKLLSSWYQVPLFPKWDGCLLLFTALDPEISNPTAVIVDDDDRNTTILQEELLLYRRAEAPIWYQFCIYKSTCSIYRVYLVYLVVVVGGGGGGGGSFAAAAFVAVAADSASGNNPFTISIAMKPFANWQIYERGWHPKQYVP